MDDNNFSSDKEKLLQCLTRFDGNITVEDVTDSSSTEVDKLNTFFIHVLLENLCRYIESDEQKRELLFSEVCDKLLKANFLSESVFLGPLIPLRRTLAEQFFNFVKQIHLAVVPDAIESNVTADSFLNGDFSTKLQLQDRYDQNFEELGVIATGGFGAVYKARHRVTDLIYAVKKVIFRYKSDSEYLKVIREAKNIAALNHPNVVRYNNAWIECLGLTGYGSRQSSKSSSDETSIDSDSDSEKLKDEISKCSKALSAMMGNENDSSSFEICFNASSIEVEERLSRHSLFVEENSSYSENSYASSFTESLTNNSKNNLASTTSETDSQSGTRTYGYDFKNLKDWDPSYMNAKVMLCIQMEYCDCDLRHWLDRRAEGGVLPFEMDVIKIFEDILTGVTYIHSKGIIHRDLKPKNIFFSKESNILKIGDFGLATLVHCEAKERGGIASSQYSANLGTLPYAAPEQIKFNTYDSKVDIYSLGIILIELLNNFSTKMELARTIDEIHRNNFPKDMQENWPNLINLVRNLVKKNPADRMTAKEIHNELRYLHNTDNTESNEVMKLKAALTEKDKEISRLKALIEEKITVGKDEEIIRLKAVVEKQRNIIKRHKLELEH